MYISEILNHPLGADRSSNECNQLVDPNLPQGHSSLNITTHSAEILPFHQLPSVRNCYFKAQILLYLLKRCLLIERTLYHNGMYTILILYELEESV